ncbi:MAG TPA: HAMP domain-containing sensor histidine kinase [Candidatus Binatia bacterium]|nr:HAMP domain-containing sensor histidine kinase [Candidatus Binatia bacterium]
MLFERVRRLRRTLAFRLTLSYAAIFTLSSLVAFFFFYLQIASILRERTDEDLLDDIQEFSALFRDKGIEEVKRTMILEAKTDGEKDVFYRLLSSDGKDLGSSELFLWGELNVSQSALRRLAADPEPVFETLSIEGRRHQARSIYAPLGPDTILQIGLSLEDDDEFLAEFRKIFGATIALVMVLAGLLGWFMAKHALANVEEITRTARAISASDLEQRVPIKGQAEEIDRLATTFNSMLDRIQALITETKEMTENIAHDLRSPITRIRGLAEMALTQSKAVDDYEAAAASTVEDCDRLLDMINTMLFISQTEATAGKLTTEEVDVGRMVRHACELFQPVAEDKGVDLVVEIASEVRVRGVLQGLQRMLANLIDNALNYTSSPGTVTVSVKGDEKTGIIEVADTGVGIPQEELAHIFRRFYRGDRSRSKPGTGLGLTLVEAVVHAHRGQIAVISTPNVGTTFSVTLPGIPRIS